MVFVLNANKKENAHYNDFCAHVTICLNCLCYFMWVLDNWSFKIISCVSNLLEVVYYLFLLLQLRFMIGESSG